VHACGHFGCPRPQHGCAARAKVRDPKLQWLTEVVDGGFDVAQAARRRRAPSEDQGNGVLWWLERVYGQP
jgi:hypothetical protein